MIYDVSIRQLDLGEGVLKTIMVGTQKGGVGKTSMSVNLAFFLGEMGKRTLLIDGDPQGNATVKLLVNDDGSINPIEGITFADCFDLDDEVPEFMSNQFGIDFIPTRLNDRQLTAINDSSLKNIDAPRKLLSILEERYDYVVIDSPPGLGSLLVTLLAVSNYLVIPIKVGAFGVEGASGILETMDSVKSNLNPNLELAGIVINDHDPNSVEEARSFEELQTQLKPWILNSWIKHRSPINTALFYGVPLKTLAYAHVATKEVNAVFNELLSRIEQ